MVYNSNFNVTDAENSELDQLLGELLSLGQDLASGVEGEPLADVSTWDSKAEGTRPSYKGHLLHDTCTTVDKFQVKKMNLLIHDP